MTRLLHRRQVNDQLDASPLKPLALPPRATFTTNGKSRPGSTAGSFRTDNQTTGAIGSTDGSNGAARAEERVLEEARLRAAADNARAPIMGADGNEHVAQGEGIQNQGEGREDWDPEEFGYNVHHNPEFGESGGDVN